MKEENYTTFVSLDFEYATSFKGSICAVGIAMFENGKLSESFYSLVQPPNNEYASVNCTIHKITPDMTANSPTFNEIFPELKKRLQNNTVVAHGAKHTERACLNQAMAFNEINEDIEIKWICTQELIGGRLNDLCVAYAINLQHHNALSDAIACGKLFIMFLNGEIHENIPVKKKEKTIRDYPGQLKGEILKPSTEDFENKDNPFYLKKVVISGFELSEKQRIAIKLKSLGADIDTTVTKKTCYLITGPNVGLKKLESMQKNIVSNPEAKILDENNLNKIINEIN